jgi:hypothetical protein
MRVVVPTSDRHLSILKGFSALFNKHWPGQDVDVIGYKEPTFELPSNFHFHSMGKQSDHTWGTSLRDFVQGLPDEPIFACADDHYPIAQVPMKEMNTAAALIETGTAAKVWMSLWNSRWTEVHPADCVVYNDELYYSRNTEEAKKEARTNNVMGWFNPSLWSKNLLLYLLRDADKITNPGKFEKSSGRTGVSRQLVQDGTKAMFFRHVFVFQHLDLLRGGRPADHGDVNWIGPFKRLKNLPATGSVEPARPTCDVLVGHHYPDLNYYEKGSCPVCDVDGTSTNHGQIMSLDDIALFDRVHREWERDHVVRGSGNRKGYQQRQPIL